MRKTQALTPILNEVKGCKCIHHPALFRRRVKAQTIKLARVFSKTVDEKISS
jgi:hypothetical protein